MQDVVSGVADAGQPFGIALDLPNGKIYWTTVPDEVRRANLNGSAIETLIPGTALDSPVAIDIDPAGGKMYITDFDQIERANLNGSNLEAIVTGLSPSPRPIALVQGAATIPTASPGMLAAFVMLVLAAGAVALRQRR